MSELRTLGKRVVVEVLPFDEKIGSIVVPATLHRREDKGRIRYLPDEVKRSVPELRVGDIVGFDPYGVLLMQDATGFSNTSSAYASVGSRAVLHVDRIFYKVVEDEAL